MSGAASTSYLSTLPDFGSAPRVAALYSDISRKKLSNPASYQSTIAWWQRTLQEWTARGLQGEHSDSLIIHADNALLESLRWPKAGKPLGLGCVVAESCTGTPPKLIPFRTFLDAKQSIYTPSSIIYRAANFVVGRPLWWALEQLSLVGGDEAESAESIWKRVQGDYVLLANVEKAADSVLAIQANKPQVSPASSLYSFESFRAQFANNALPGTTLSDADLKVLIRYLARDKHRIVTDNDIIKFVDDASGHETISEVDVGVLQMQTAVSRLEAQVEEIQRQIMQRTEKIATALRAAQKTVAMSYLRSRKQLEDLLNKRLGALDTLHTQFAAVERAVGDAEIMQAYETSTRTLRAALANPLLQRDRVDATLDDMAEALADHREIDDAIRTGSGAEDIDDDEIMAELAGLEAEVQREQKQKLEEEERRAEDELVQRLANLRTPTEGAAADAKEQSRTVEFSQAS